MAGLPEELIAIAAEASKQFEAQHGSAVVNQSADRALPLGLESDLATLLATVEGKEQEVTEGALLRIADYACSVLA
jgi:hypothetical protein